jgi:hypothetical protein
MIPCCMITKEQLKKEIDKVPENLLDEVYSSLKKIVYKRKKKITSRDFHGKFDHSDIRKAAYE